MARLTVHTRSFHPLENFGGGGLGYEGDNRDFTTSLKVTSRIFNIIEIDLPSSHVVRFDTDSSPSRNAVLGWDQTYESKDLKPTAQLNKQIDRYRADGDQHIRLHLSYRGQNFAMPGIDNETMRNFYKGTVPDLDVTHALSISIDRTARKLTFASRLVGDGFPNTEAFLVDASGRDAVFLAVHRRVGSATGQLGGNRRIAMAAGSAKVDFPEDRWGSGLQAYWAQDFATHTGNMIDLMEEFGRKPASVSDWNRMHSAHDAKGGRVRRWWLDNDVVWVRGRPGSSLP